MLKKSVLGLCAPIAMVLLASGCVVGPKYKTPEVPIAQQWRDTGQPQFTGQPVDRVEWWKSLNDPVLDSLIRQAFDQNLTLQAASLRIVQARVGHAVAGWSFAPIITGQGSISHNDYSTSVKPEVSVSLTEPQRKLPPAVREQLMSNLPAVSVTPEMDVYSAGFDAVWEMDLWGKYRQLFRSTGEQLKAAFASYDAIMVSLAAEVARTYIRIRTLDQRLAALNSLNDTLDRFVALTEERYKNKKALITDVQLAELLAGTVQSWIPPLEAERRQAENNLCVLLGKAPQTLHQDIGTTGAIPVAPVQNVVGIPADLLRRRPDVRVAEHMAAAQCARVGIAKAAILPSFNIFGSIGLSSSDSDKFFRSDSVSSTYGGLLNVSNLILYPVTVELVRNEDAQFQEALLNYRETVLNANLEVENSLYSFLKAQDETTVLEDNVDEALDAAQTTMAAYKEGKVIVSVPLAALTFLASQQDQMWAWRGQATTDYVAIYKALGGGWQNRVGQELVPEQIREQMKNQADWWSFTGKHDLSTIQVKDKK
ncbi:efflux transporter outer membrane subunit [bacterium]|nr:efflux transporter outer membrane subunit [bacterium]